MRIQASKDYNEILKEGVKVEMELKKHALGTPRFVTLLQKLWDLNYEAKEAKSKRNATMKNWNAKHSHVRSTSSNRKSNHSRSHSSNRTHKA